MALSDVIVGALTWSTAHTWWLSPRARCAPGSFVSLTAVTLMETCCSECLRLMDGRWTEP